MRRVVIESSQRSTLRLVGTGEGKSGTALSPFGPVRAGLITMQRTNKEVPLTVLLSSLERQITEANIKSYAVLNTLISGTNPPAKLGTSSLNINITNAIQE